MVVEAYSPSAEVAVITQVPEPPTVTVRDDEEGKEQVAPVCEVTAYVMAAPPKAVAAESSVTAMLAAAPRLMKVFVGAQVMVCVARGVTAEDPELAAPDVAVFAALTLKVYEVPFVRPVTTADAVAEVPSARVVHEPPFALDSTM